MEENESVISRRWKWFLLSLACLAALIAGFYLVENTRGKLAWERFKAQQEAKGEKFDYRAFVPPQVPWEQNFAMTPVVAGSYSRILDRQGHKISPQNTNVVNRLEMKYEAGHGEPTNGTGNWQKARKCNLEEWQRYYRNLAQPANASGTAFATFKRPNNTQFADRRYGGGLSDITNLFTVAPAPQTPAADVLLALSKYDATIEELRRAAALPESRFPLNYQEGNPFQILLPHLAPLKGCASVLRLRALAELDAGQSDAALADVCLALRLAQTVRSEPCLISQLVRISMLQITVQPIWEGVVDHRWTDDQLSQLERQLAGLDYAADYLAAMRAECAAQMATIDFLRRHPDQLFTMTDENDNGQQLPGLVLQLLPSGWFYQNQLCSSKFVLEQLLPIIDARRQTFSPSATRQSEQALTAMRHTPYTILCRMFNAGLTRSSLRFAYAQAVVNLSRTACALERCRLAQGKYPEALEVLAPQFISKVPGDPIDGQPLHYRLTDNGQFMLYSIGWNEKDDDGVVSLTKTGTVDLENGDWVWRAPESRQNDMTRK